MKSILTITGALLLPILLMLSACSDSKLRLVVNQPPQVGSELGSGKVRLAMDQGFLALQ